MSIRNTFALLVSLVFSVACIEEQTEQVTSNVFHSVMEDFDNQTKTTLGNRNTVVWAFNDYVSIFRGSTKAECYMVQDHCAGTPNGEFLPCEESTDNGFYSGNEIPVNVAIYPYSSDHICWGPGVSEDGADTYTISNVTLPQVQYYTYDSFPEQSFVMMAVTKDVDDKYLKFKNALGAIKFSFTGTGLIKQIRLLGNSGEPLAGTVSVSKGINSTPTIEFGYADYYPELILDCGDGVLLNPETPTTFIMSVPPTNFENGFTVVVEDTEGVQQTFYTNDDRNQIIRSSILTMPNMEISLSVPAPVEEVTIKESFNRIGQKVIISGVVKGTSSIGVILSDETADVFVYYGNGYDQQSSIGDHLSVKGHISLYNHTYEFNEAATALNGHCEVEPEEATVIDQEFVHDALEALLTGQTPAIESQYVEFEGYMLGDNFIRIADTDELVVIYYPNSEMSAIKSRLTYEKVRVKGYTFSIRSNTYFNIIPSSIEVIGNESNSLEEALGSTGRTLTGNVAATSSVGYVLDSNGESIFIYCRTTNFGYVIGDNVTVDGIFKTFDYGQEIFKVSSQWNSFDENFTAPVPETLDYSKMNEDITTAKSLLPFKDGVISAKYITSTGTLVQNGTKYEIHNEGSPYPVAIFNPNTEISSTAADLVGQSVGYTGYAINLGVAADRLAVVITSLYSL